MANYLERNLGRDEKVVLRAKISWLTLIPQVLWLIICIVGAVALTGVLSDGNEATGGQATDGAVQIGAILWAVFLVLGGLPLLVKALKNATTVLAVTNKRVIGKVGVLKIDTIDFHIDKVDNISYKAGVFGNLFHYATVEVKGGGGDSRTIPAIANAAQFKNMVNEAVELHAEEARKAQAAEIAAAMAGGKTPIV